MRFITHEDAYEVTTKNHGKVVVNAGTLEFPQVDSVAEFVEFCAGEEKAVTLINDLLYGRSKNGALAVVRNAASDSTPVDAVTKAAAFSKGYNPSQERTSKKDLLDNVDKIRELGKEKLQGMTQEELVALLESSFKL